MTKRILNWDGCKNVRDLGGLRTADGRITRYGAMVRSDTPAKLTPAGWTALYAHGIRTIITLCTHGMKEDELDFSFPHPDIEIQRVEIEDVTDREFVQLWASTDFWSTPLYYKDAILRWPRRHAEAISAIARAKSGGVLYHCVRGTDRTGIISLLLLSLVGVTQDEILADYELSADPERNKLLASRNSSVPEALFSAVNGIDIDNYLISGGANPADLEAVRTRLLG